MLLRHCTNSRSGNLRRGFSLVEVLIAIGILGVGLGMVMLIFPAAVMENRSSTNNVIGTIMCENALAIAKIKITSTDVSSVGSLFTTVSDTVLTAEDLKFADNDTRGTLVLCREDGTQYLLAAVAYQKKHKDNPVRAEPFTATLQTDEAGKWVILNDPDPTEPLPLKLGCTVLAENGRFSTVTGIDGNKVTVKDDLSINGVTPTNFTVLLETINLADTPIPAMQVMVAPHWH